MSATYIVTACAPASPGPSRLTVRRQYDYWYRGAETEPFHGEPTPRQIVARLHRQIAAKSPEHARLVAEFEALSCDEENPRNPLSAQSAARRVRIEEFAGLMKSGLTVKAAARRVGISERVGRAYRHEIEKEASGD